VKYKYIYFNNMNLGEYYQNRDEAPSKGCKRAFCEALVTKTASPPQSFEIRKEILLTDGDNDNLFCCRDV